MKQTKGTWVAKCYERTNKCFVVAGDKVIFEQLTDATNSISPDAHLIAAAPDMLEALEEAIRLIATAEHQGAFDNCALPKIGQRTLNKLEALISRAKGE